MGARESITAVVPVHDRVELLDQLLKSLRSQSLPFAEIIVIDNASVDAAAVQRAAHDCKLIRQAENTGFARAVNLGWRMAANGWIAILNSDVTLDPQWLERLVGQAAEFSFATGTIFDATDRQAIDGTYDLLSRSGCGWRAGFGERPELERTASRIAVAPGTACLFRREVLEKLGGFDEEYGSYLEDVDLGLRCVKEGYEGVYVTSAIAWHQGSATLGRWNPRVVRLISRNQLLLIRRHYDRELFRACLWPILAGQLLWGLVAVRHGATFAWLAGKFDALREFRLEGIPSARLSAFLAASEAEIQKRARDPYWRWYFRLTSAASGAAH